MSIATTGAAALRHLISFSGESVELAGKSLQAFIDPGAVELEQVAGGRQVIEELEMVVSTDDFNERPKINSKAKAREQAMRVNSVESEPGLWRITLSRPRG